MNDVSDIMERIRLIASDLQMSGREFSASIEQSNSYLATVPKKGIRSDVLTKIIINHPEYNINWVLTGVGAMKLSASLQVSGDIKDRLIEVQKELSEVQKEVNEARKETIDAHHERDYYKNLLEEHGISANYNAKKAESA